MMKTYNFDEIIDRSGSGDLKHEALLPRWGRNDLLREPGRQRLQ